MSTFNGIIDEFPSIRIDYFRHHPSKPAPQACFLSHVHSDHLQGLETLKMPFVYCSAATKRILLRMEKYPHRINFAKGILEARKQTYKSLKLVLRELPLETPVEIELGPKLKIRVTLFDANHCPGAVSFLIEGHGHSIFYSGDVRAESWWVNSIIRSPILLPYSSGTKRLDCMYLDTTFASHDDICEHFPTKAEGLKELLTKVSKCPKSSLFYFRSWTLGYEDVWIALSNFLQSSIHVDGYQLRIFKSLADDANPIDRGPVLAGFTFGNHYQLGCLTDDSTVPIHSCEPGTACHDEIKKRNDVVWITPIISRLKDGTEIAEIGAGGGGGDLYQIPQLEIVDETALQALDRFCAGNVKQKEALDKLKQSFSIARSKGESSITLEGFGLDQDEELSLKQFMQLFSRNNASTNDDSKLLAGSQRVIHFPYSRHSSFSELRHLVSCLRPKDIYPCTVDVDAWSEDISVESLFGDLCSERYFKHDKEMKSVVEGRGGSTVQKRKRGPVEEDSQNTESQASTRTDEAFKSARTSLRQPDSDNPGNRVQLSTSGDSSSIIPPTPIRHLQRELSNRFTDLNQGNEHTSANVASTDVDINDYLDGPHESVRTDVNAQVPCNSRSDVSNNTDRCDDNGVSLTSSIFHSQNQDDLSQLKPSSTSVVKQHTPRHKSKRLSQPDGQSVRDGIAASASDLSDTEDRVEARLSAYKAAKVVLNKSDYGQWQDLRIRSLGWKGHTEEEAIL